MRTFVAANPKDEALAFEDNIAGHYARGVRHVHRRVKFRTKAGFITASVACAADGGGAEVEIPEGCRPADVRPIRLRPQPETPNPGGRDGQGQVQVPPRPREPR